MRNIKHSFRVGDKVTAAAGYQANGEPRPNRVGVIEELYGPNDWPRVQWDDKPYSHLETCVPSALTRLVQ